MTEAGLNAASIDERGVADWQSGAETGEWKNTSRQEMSRL